MVLQVLLAFASLAQPPRKPPVTVPTPPPIVDAAREATISDEARAELWSVRYNMALDHLRNAAWDKAITLLRTSIAIDPTPQENRPIGRGVSEHYFPHYYLFIAYLKSGQLAKAREYYVVRGPLPKKLADEARLYEQELIKAEQQLRR